MWLLFDGVVGFHGTVKGAEPAVWAIGHVEAVLVRDGLGRGDDAARVPERVDADPAVSAGRHGESLVATGLKLVCEATPRVPPGSRRGDRPEPVDEVARR